MSWTPPPPPGSPPPPPPGAPPPGYGPGGYGPGGYGPGGYGGYGGYGAPTPPPEHPQGTIVLVLGLAGLVFCQILGPFAWSMGSKALKEIDASGIPYSNRSMVQAGRICGMVATGLLVLTILAFGFFLVAAVLVGTSTESEFQELESMVRGLGATGAR